MVEENGMWCSFRYRSGGSEVDRSIFNVVECLKVVDERKLVIVMGALL